MSISIEDLDQLDFSDVVEPGASLIPPTHPGEILLNDFMEPLELSANAVAAALGVPANRITGILNKSRAITPDTALRIARYFGTTAEFWLGLQTSYDLQKARRELGADIERRVVPRGAGQNLNLLAG